MTKRLGKTIPPPSFQRESNLGLTVVGIFPEKTLFKKLVS
jgi:hypothetical protein